MKRKRQSSHISKADLFNSGGEGMDSKDKGLQEPEG